ncbi:hypothetical protein BJF79_48335 [Actinomadura sp. CNU-125]|uniref:hypothetical protein n=1 Tax=Actinomadura sp. CNU-125 TaxID=1904961 RepID=UPI00096031AB|nr:hypothetical protein [Actinomadura sp. CNU-125]OLT17756.1 hypothetical protein BJF79_48335 [Actinomadura sp. CNU-125]
MTYLSGLLGLVAVAMMVALVVLAVRRDRALRRNAPQAAAASGPGPRGRRDGGQAGPPARVP